MIKDELFYISIFYQASRALVVFMAEEVSPMSPLGDKISLEGTIDQDEAVGPLGLGSELPQ